MECRPPILSFIAECRLNERFNPHRDSQLGMPVLPGPVFPCWLSASRIVLLGCPRDYEFAMGAGLSRNVPLGARKFVQPCFPAISLTKPS